MPYAALLAATRIADYLGLHPHSRRWSHGAAVVAGVIWLVAIPAWLARPEVKFGFGLDERMHPVGAARFIATHRPSRELLHFQGDGNYILGALPDYPVFLDTRESMYEHLGGTYRDMVNDPALWAEVVSRYGIRTILVPEAFLLTPWRSDASRRAAFLPKRDYALVYFDETHAVFVRRTAEHAALIAEHEYEWLLPYRDPLAYLALHDRSARRDQAFAREVRRCLLEVPGLEHCRRARDGWAQESLAADAFSDGPPTRR